MRTAYRIASAAFFVMVVGAHSPVQARASVLSGYEPGTIVVKTGERKLYLVLENGDSSQRHRPGIIVVEPCGIGRGPHPHVLAGAELNARGSLLPVALKPCERIAEVEFAGREAARQNNGVLHG